MIYWILIIFQIVFASDLENTELIVNGQWKEDVSHCSLETSEKPSFYVTDTSDLKAHPWYENLRVKSDKNSKSLGELSVGSMVQVGQSTEYLVGERSYAYVFVLNHSRYRKKLRRPVRGAVRGYMFGRSIKRPEEWKYFVKKSRIKGLESSEDSHFLEGKVLQVHASSDGYHFLDCCKSDRCQDYPIFSVKDPESDETLSYFAFSPKEFGFASDVVAFRRKASQEDVREIIGPKEVSRKNQSTVFKSQTFDSISSLKKSKENLPFVRDTVIPEKREQDRGESIKLLEVSLRPQARSEKKTAAKSFLASLFFPLKKAPTRNFTTGMRRFGARRRGGRKHAGSDLYRPLGEEVLAIKDGVILRRYSFYLGTYALEIRNSDGSIYRYAELSGKRAPGTAQGTAIRAGQLIGYVGRMRGLSKTMLHFEKYSGRSHGALTQRGNPPYKRRKDLVDPTEMLVQLARKKKFM